MSCNSNAIIKPLPERKYPQIEVVTKGLDGADDTITLKDDLSQVPLNFKDIENWIENNNKARGNIMLRLHNVIACHDFRRFPPFLILSPKHPHSLTQPMTCFPFSFLHDLYHFLSYLLNWSFWISRTSQSIRHTRRLISLGLQRSPIYWEVTSPSNPTVYMWVTTLSISSAEAISEESKIWVKDRGPRT